VLRKSFAHLGDAGGVLVERYLREVVFDYEFAMDVGEDFKAALRAENGGVGLPATQRNAEAAMHQAQGVMESARASDELQRQQAAAQPRNE